MHTGCWKRTIYICYFVFSLECQISDFEFEHFQSCFSMKSNAGQGRPLPCNYSESYEIRYCRN